MVSIKEVLSKIGECRTVAAISRELDIRESTLQAMLEFMTEKGYLEEIEGGGGCAGCSVNKKCNIPAPRERKPKMYALTKAGMGYIMEP